jgi:hypothetical protein
MFSWRLSCTPPSLTCSSQKMSVNKVVGRWKTPKTLKPKTLTPKTSNNTLYFLVLIIKRLYFLLFIIFIDFRNDMSFNEGLRVLHCSVTSQEIEMCFTSIKYIKLICVIYQLGIFHYTFRLMLIILFRCFSALVCAIIRVKMRSVSSLLMCQFFATKLISKWVNKEKKIKSLNLFFNKCKTKTPSFRILLNQY